MSSCSMIKLLLLSTIAIMLLSSALALPFHPLQHRHRKHLNRRLFTSSYTIAGAKSDGRRERANNNADEVQQVMVVRQNVRSLNLLNPLLRPDRAASTIKGDARIYRIGAAEGRLRSSPFKDGYKDTMKKILLRMN